MISVYPVIGTSSPLASIRFTSVHDGADVSCVGMCEDPGSLGVSTHVRGK